MILIETTILPGKRLKFDGKCFRKARGHPRLETTRFSSSVMNYLRTLKWFPLPLVSVPVHETPHIRPQDPVQMLLRKYLDWFGSG